MSIICLLFTNRQFPICTRAGVAPIQKINIPLFSLTSLSVFVVVSIYAMYICLSVCLIVCMIIIIIYDSSSRAYKFKVLINIGLYTKHLTRGLSSNM